MDLSGLINNQKLDTFKNQFNSSELNFENVSKQNLVTLTDDKEVCIDKIVDKQNREKLIKDLFVMLADTSDFSYIIKKLKTKYGKLVDDKIITCCIKLCDVIGNYIITCRYNDNLGKKNPTFVKYVLFCDCGGQDQVQNYVGQGSVDGFFKENKKVKVSKIKICKKHNLPVLANIDDLTQADLNELIKKVSQVNQIKSDNCKNGSVINKIARIFHNLKQNKYAKVDNSKYIIKEANTQLIANVSNSKKSINVKDVSKPVQKDFTVASQMNNIQLNDVQTNKQVKFNLKSNKKYDSVNMPTNSVTVDVKKAKKSMDNFTILPNKYDDLSLANVKDSNVTITAKNMPIAVQKQSKYVQNICIKTKPVDEGFDMKDDFVFDIQKNKDNQIVIDTNNQFNF